MIHIVRNGMERTVEIKASGDHVLVTHTFLGDLDHITAMTPEEANDMAGKLMIVASEINGRKAHANTEQRGRLQVIKGGKSRAGHS